MYWLPNKTERNDLIFIGTRIIGMFHEIFRKNGLLDYAQLISPMANNYYYFFTSFNSGQISICWCIIIWLRVVIENTYSFAFHCWMNWKGYDSYLCPLRERKYLNRTATTKRISQSFPFVMYCLIFCEWCHFTIESS